MLSSAYEVPRMPLNVRKTTVSEIEKSPAFSKLVPEYAEECRISGMPYPEARLDIYEILEKAGRIQLFGAWLDETLIGFIAVLATVLPHYGVVSCVAESFFAAK